MRRPHLPYPFNHPSHFIPSPPSRVPYMRPFLGCGRKHAPESSLIGWDWEANRHSRVLRSLLLLNLIGYTVGETPESINHIEELCYVKRLGNKLEFSIALLRSLHLLALCLILKLPVLVECLIRLQTQSASSRHSAVFSHHSGLSASSFAMSVHIFIVGDPSSKKDNSSGHSFPQLNHLEFFSLLAASYLCVGPS